eukprot:scaffold1.g5888.t1
MAGPRPVPRPGITKARSCCSVSLSKTLITLPLVLAAIALLLQFSGKQPSPEASALTLTGHMERSMLLESQQHPKLETSGRRRTQLERPARGGGRLGARRAPGLGQAWRAPEPSARLPRVAFMVTTSDSLAQISVWLAYHRAMGVGTFYLFVDGQAARPEVQEALRRERGVRVVPRDAELKRRHEGSRIWNETWLSAFFHKPCNHELFVIQSLNMEVGIQMAQADGQDWVLHVDTDELIYPSGSPDLSVQEVLAQVPEDVDTLVFPNYESLPEADDVADPFTQVTLFKKNYGHVVPDVYFKNYGTIARGNPNYFITYGNGKSAARVQEGLRPNGAHRWHSYTKMPKEWSSDQAAVLHYTYNRFQDLKSRRDRCDCAPTEEDAKRCFILPFDRRGRGGMAFLEASLKTDEELLKWFRERLVWSDPEVVNDLLKKGLFARIYEPQARSQGAGPGSAAAPQRPPLVRPPARPPTPAHLPVCQPNRAPPVQIMIRGFLQAAKAGAAGGGVAVAQSSAGAAASGASPSSDSTGAAAVGAADSAGTAVGTAASSGAGAAQKAAAVAGMRDEVDAARQAAAAEQHAATGSTALGSATTTADAAALKEAAVSAAQAQAAAAATAQTQQAATTEQAAAAAQQAAAAAGAAAQQAAGTGTQAAGANAQSAAVANQQAAGAQQVAAGGATGQAGGGAQATVAGDAQAAGAGQVAQQQQQQQAAAAGGGTAGADGQTAGQAVGAVQQAVGAGQAVAGGQATQAATQQQAAAADAAAAAAAAQRAQEVATAATAGLQHAAVVQTQAGAQAQAATA